MSSPAPTPTPPTKTPVRRTTRKKRASAKTLVTPTKKNAVGRPKKAPIIRLAKGFKYAATGDTSAAPGTSSNLFFIMAIVLVVASGWSSGRIQELFKSAWNTGTMNDANSADVFVEDLRITGTQLIFVFFISFFGRAFPVVGRASVFMILAIWLLWLMKNPQILILLNNASQKGSTKTSSTASTNNSVGASLNAALSAIQNNSR